MGSAGVINVVFAIVLTIGLRRVSQHLAQLLALPSFLPSSHRVYSWFTGWKYLPSLYI
jgi:hypothetical protein